jgi:hypothetical protein
MQQIFIDLTYARPKMAVNCFAAARQTLERAAHRNKIENFQNFVSRFNRNSIDFQFWFFSIRCSLKRDRCGFDLIDMSNWFDEF